METYPWWSEEQKVLAEEVEGFADERLSRGEEVAWTKEYPSDLLAEAAERGWFGALIPRDYEGMGVGVTGCCIIAEGLSRVCAALVGAYSVTLFGGVEQLLKFGDDLQKRKWLPQFAKGKLGAICITEPGVGSDAASIETAARREGDEYVINGKKRFITNAGAADVYLVYARTSDRPEDRAKYRHLSAFLVEKGVKGFSVERINELSGWPGLLNGYLDFDEVRVPIENRIGAEGDGWKVMIEGLNFERVLFAAGMLGPMREALRYAVAYSQRRVQFGTPTIEFEVNQFKVADMIADLKTSRLLVYYAAHLMDLNVEPILDATIAKLYSSEAYGRVLRSAVQLMGGDGWTRFYPIEAFLRDEKVVEIGAGTSEVMRMIIFRQGLRAMAKLLEMPYRVIHPNLNVPVSTKELARITKVNEEAILNILAEDYRVNPGLYMSKEDMLKVVQNVAEEQLDLILTSLETKGLAKLYRDKRGRITLAKATYEGLRKAKPLDYYKWHPSWVDKALLF